MKVCPKCGSTHLVKNGYRIRDIYALPIGRRIVILRTKVQRYKCKECCFDQQERIPYTVGSRSYTKSFEEYVIQLLKCMSIKDLSILLDVSWNTIKDIHRRYLKKRYKPVSLEDVDCIGIDEFAVHKGHTYKTIVVDLRSGRIIYVGNGKGADALDDFWERAKKEKLDIKYVSSDLSAAFTASIRQNCPRAIHVFDHFHVIKLMNDNLDDIRSWVFNKESDEKLRKIIKGTRYLLLSNGADIEDCKFKNRLDNALKLNELLSKAYYLKEQLGQIWQQPSKLHAHALMDTWIEQANKSGVPQLKKMAKTLEKHSQGILSWYDCRISNGRVEGINNKIKVMNRNAYGFRDEEYYELRLLSLHDCKITRNVG